jgi:hypothetical protein
MSKEKQQVALQEAMDSFLKEFNPIDVLEAINSLLIYSDTSKLSDVQKERVQGNVILLKKLTQATS